MVWVGKPVLNLPVTNGMKERAASTGWLAGESRYKTKLSFKFSWVEVGKLVLSLATSIANTKSGSRHLSLTIPISKYLKMFKSHKYRVLVLILCVIEMSLMYKYETLNNHHYLITFEKFHSTMRKLII